jgi:hypothetical protein
LDVVVGAKHSISIVLWMHEVGWRMLRPYPGIKRRRVHGWESQGHGTPCLSQGGWNGDGPSTCISASLPPNQRASLAEAGPSRRSSEPSQTAIPA